MADEGIAARRLALERKLGRKPTLAEVFYRDFTGTGQYRAEELGAPPRGEPRGRRKVR